jgi:hypothetical protein
MGRAIRAVPKVWRDYEARREMKPDERKLMQAVEVLRQNKLLRKPIALHVKYALKKMEKDARRNDNR